MIKVLLDTNIYDRLAKDADAVARITLLSEAEVLCIIASRTVQEELFKSPFNGIPNFIPIQLMGNTVGRVGIMCAGDHLGAGDVYYSHLGGSRKTNDAFVADAAACLADWLVSEDRRLISRFNQGEGRCEAMNYAQFLSRLDNICEKENR